MDLKEQIEQLSDEIKRHEYNYFVLDESTISEYELESLKLELDRLVSVQNQKITLEEFV